MEGKGKGKEIEKGGHCDTLKKAKEKDRKRGLKLSREGEDSGAGTHGSEIKVPQYHITTEPFPFVF